MRPPIWGWGPGRQRAGQSLGLGFPGPRACLPEALSPASSPPRWWAEEASLKEDGVRGHRSPGGRVRGHCGEGPLGRALFLPLGRPGQRPGSPGVDPPLTLLAVVGGPVLGAVGKVKGQRSRGTACCSLGGWGGIPRGVASYQALEEMLALSFGERTLGGVGPEGSRHGGCYGQLGSGCRGSRWPRGLILCVLLSRASCGPWL